jgi:copper(I)-binding protein
MKFTQLLCASAVILFTQAVFAHEYTAGSLHIGHPYARATAPGQPAAGAYIGLTNNGTAADKLVSASSPVAQRVEIHTMSMEGNVMKMRALDGLEVKPGQTIKMQPGQGEHIMLMGLQQPLKEGESVPMTLVFEKAGKVDVSVKVEAAGAAGAHKHEHH